MRELLLAHQTAKQSLNMWPLFKKTIPYEVCLMIKHSYSYLEKTANMLAFSLKIHLS